VTGAGKKATQAVDRKKKISYLYAGNRYTNSVILLRDIVVHAFIHPHWRWIFLIHRFINHHMEGTTV
jgi:hypothetical protein